MSEESRTIGWSIHAELHFAVKARGRQLHVVVIPVLSEWMLFAAEARVGLKSVDDLLGDHAHQGLPNQPDIASATAFAERYAKAWLQDPSTALEACGCTGLCPPNAACPVIPEAARQI